LDVKKKLAVVCLAQILILLMLTSGASATAFYDAFPSNNAAVVDSGGLINDPFYIGYFFSNTNGHMVQETFTDTGLESVVGLKLSLAVAQDTLTTYPLTWNVLVNDLFVGTWTQRPIDGTGPKEFQYIFPDIVGDGTYTIAMRVKYDIPAGGGSIALGYTSYPGFGSLLLVGCPIDENGGQKPVPEPATMLLLGSGLLGLAGFRRNLRKN